MDFDLQFADVDDVDDAFETARGCELVADGDGFDCGGVDADWADGFTGLVLGDEDLA